MKIIFADRDAENAAALAHAFAGAPDVEVHAGDIFDHAAEAIVSPANSMGFMDGGIDLAYSNHFGWDLQDRLQAMIRGEYDGELLVGQAALVATNDARIPWMISAPTMRVPMNLVNSVNVYLAFRAALRCAKGREVASVLCPAMGTGVGRMEPMVAASQMLKAFWEVVQGKVDHYPDDNAAYQAHLMIARGNWLP